MIPLSPRLRACASLVTGDAVCDIGTDHAYLPAFLVTSGKCSRAVATDIKEGPLESARGTLKRYNAAKQVTLVLSDGFDKVSTKGITDAVIAGLGGESIRDILAAKSAGFLKTGVNLVLQPMSKAEVLRAWLAENGFVTDKELAVKDAHLYTVMQVHYTGEKRTLTPAQSYIGRLRRSDPLTRAYMAVVLDRLHTRAHGLDDAGQADAAAAVRAIIRDINTWMAGGTL